MMKAAICIFFILFTGTFLMHKPFNIHTSQKRWVQEIYRYLEIACVMQKLLMLNMLFW